MTTNEIVGQIDLLDGSEVIETIEVSNETIVTEVVDAVFGSDETITSYKIAKVINSILEIHNNDKRIPPQMMYQYASKGMLNGVKGQKQFNKDEVTTYVTKYTNKHI